MKKITSKGQITMGTILSFASLGIGYVTSIIYTPVMLRLLGQSEYGLYTLVSSTVSYLGILSIGFSAAYVRFFFKEKQKGLYYVARLNGIYLLIYLCIGILVLLVGAGLIEILPELLQNRMSVEDIVRAQRLMVILVLQMALTFPASLFESCIIARERFIFLKSMQIVKALLSPFLTLPLLFMGYASTALVLVSFAISMLSNVCNIWYCLKRLDMRISFRGLELSLVRSLTAFSGYIFVNAMVDQINWNVDKMLLGIFQGTSAVAVYGISAQISGYYRSFSVAVSNQYVPHIHRLVSSKETDDVLLSLMIRVGRIQCLVLFPLCAGLILFGQVFIRLWAGKAYADSYIALLVLLIPSTIPLIQNLGIEIQKAKNLHKFRSLVYLLIALCNIVISIPLCMWYGPIGSAAGTAVSLVIGNGIIMNWYYHYRCGLDMIQFWRCITGLLKGLVIPIGMGCIARVCILKDSVFSLLVCLLIFSASYAVSMYVLALNKEEKSLVQKLWIRRK